MVEYTTLCIQRRPGQAMWRTEVPIAGTETGLLVGWPTIHRYMALFGWRPSAIRPVRCWHLSAQELALTALEILFVRAVPSHPDREGVCWPTATYPEGRSHGNET